MTRLLALCLGLALAACAKPAPVAVDGSSQAAFTQSLSDMRDQLGVTERAKFEAAMKLIEARAFGKAADRQQYQALLRQELAGKTAKDIIAIGDAERQRLQDKALDAAFEAKKALSPEAQQAASEAAKLAGDAAKQAAREALQEVFK